MAAASETLRRARREAGLTQAQVAHRLGTAQSAVAHLERGGSNPTVETLRNALAVTGHELVLEARPRPASVDESLIVRALKMTPAQRIAEFEESYAGARALAGRRSRGELA
jgi:transcriptional regulator with XRE-family HTH domain